MLSEMLGNKYFLSRNYSNAATNLQHVLIAEPFNKPVKKKLIICYTQIGEIQKSLDLFHSLIQEDIDFVINTDHYGDDCPCPELVDKFGTILPYEENSTDLKIMLGILWLYCNAEKSLKFFQAASVENPENEILKSITSIIEGRLKNKNLHN